MRLLKSRSRVRGRRTNLQATYLYRVWHQRGSLVRLNERHNMTNESKRENHPANERQVNSALVQLSEPELVRLLNRVKALQKEFRRIRSSDGDPVEAVIAIKGLLKVWNDELDRILAAKQAKDSLARLHNWDNEGGRNDWSPHNIVC